MKKIVRMVFLGITVVFLSGCGGIDAIVDAIKNSWFSSEVVYNIPDVGSVSSPIEVNTTTHSITEVLVRVNIEHTAVGELDIYLVSSNNNWITLSTGNGGDGDNFQAFFGDEEDSDSITIGSAPFSGGYQPEEALANLNGEDPNGTWRLVVLDNDAGNTGKIKDWMLVIYGTE